MRKLSVITGVAFLGLTDGLKKIYAWFEEHQGPPVSKESLEAHHEVSDIDTMAIGWFGLGLIVAAVWMFFVIGGWFSGLEHHFVHHQALPTEASLISQRQIPPMPRLQVFAHEDLEGYLHHEQHLLGTFGWMDQGKGVVRIPIEKAMDLVVSQHGLEKGQGR